MTTRNYSVLTIKKLYGLSGNQCAFSGCQRELISSDGKINVSDICHIEGEEKNSPRFNPALGIKQLNDYDNLILMCKTDHKIIDSDVSKYTVEYLRQIKYEHEQKNRDKKFSISDEIAEEIIREQISQVNMNVGSGSQNVTGTGDIHVQYGISVSEINGLVEDLFIKNMPKLREEAQKTAQESITQYNQILLEMVKSKLEQTDIEKFSEPDVQYVLTESILQAARKNEPELRENLAYLLVERVKNSDDDLRRIVYNEAIETIGKLTRDGLKIITLCFILKYATWNNVNNYERLNELIETQVTPLFDFKNTNAEFQHIAYTGCGELGIGEWSYDEQVVTQYQLELFTVPISSVISYNLPNMIITELFSDLDEQNYLFNV